MLGSESKLSLILSQIISTSLSNTALTFILSFAEVSKNSRPVKDVFNLKNSKSIDKYNIMLKGST